MLCTYDVLYKTLENAGHTPKFNIMDNEVSTALKWLSQKRITVVQLDPLHTHRRNSAEHAICTFKNHFVEGLASVETNFPIYMWCQILKQSKITINLLRNQEQTQGYRRMHKYLEHFLEFFKNRFFHQPNNPTNLNLLLQSNLLQSKKWYD